MTVNDRVRPVPRGHVFRLNARGEIDTDLFDAHEWVMCIVCKDTECVECGPDFLEEACQGADTLSGLDWVDL